MVNKVCISLHATVNYKRVSLGTPQTRTQVWCSCSFDLVLTSNEKCIEVVNKWENPSKCKYLQSVYKYANQVFVFVCRNGNRRPAHKPITYTLASVFLQSLFLKLCIYLFKKQKTKPVHTVRRCAEDTCIAFTCTKTHA